MATGIFDPTIFGFDKIFDHGVVSVFAQLNLGTFTAVESMGLGSFTGIESFTDIYLALESIDIGNLSSINSEDVGNMTAVNSEDESDFISPGNT